MNKQPTTAGITSLHHATHTIALCVVGTVLRGDDGLASVLLGQLPDSIKSEVCLFDAGPYSRHLPEFLHEHKLAIILDAAERAQPGRIIKVDISTPAGRRHVAISGSHGISWLEEIDLARGRFTLPERLIFLGLPVASTAPGQNLSQAASLWLPGLGKQLREIIQQEWQLLLNCNLRNKDQVR